MCLYFIFQRDPVGILAYLPNSFIYFRNLLLVRKKRTRAHPLAAASQTPREESPDRTENAPARLA